jgi:hypothetical protein
MRAGRLRAGILGLTVSLVAAGIALLHHMGGIGANGSDVSRQSPRGAQLTTSEARPPAAPLSHAVVRTFDGRRLATPASAVLRLKVVPVRRAKKAAPGSLGSAEMVTA